MDHVITATIEGIAPGAVNPLHAAVLMDYGFDLDGDQLHASEYSEMPPEVEVEVEFGHPAVQALLRRTQTAEEGEGDPVAQAVLEAIEAETDRPTVEGLIEAGEPEPFILPVEPDEDFLHQTLQAIVRSAGDNVQGLDLFITGFNPRSETGNTTVAHITANRILTGSTHALVTAFHRIARADREAVSIPADRTAHLTLKGNTVIGSTLKAPEEEDASAYNGAMEVLEALVLAHHQAGVDVQGLAYQAGLREAIEAAANNL